MRKYIPLGICISKNKSITGVQWLLALQDTVYFSLHSDWPEIRCANFPFKVHFLDKFIRVEDVASNLFPEAIYHHQNIMYTNIVADTWVKVQIKAKENENYSFHLKVCYSCFACFSCYEISFCHHLCCSKNIFKGSRIIRLPSERNDQYKYWSIKIIVLSWRMLGFRMRSLANSKLIVTFDENDLVFIFGYDLRYVYIYTNVYICLSVSLY